MRFYFLMMAMLIFASGCSGMRSVGYKETYKLEPAKCGDIGVEKRDGKCFRKTIWGLKDTGKFREEIVIAPDGSQTKITEIDNAGHPGALSDLAKLATAGVAAKVVDMSDND